MDRLTPERRSENMRRIRSRGTKPELLIRRLTHRLGYRFRLYRSDLPGCPDLVFPGRRKVVFVHGCFWHGHHCAVGSRVPKSNVEYWTKKIARNRARDVAARNQLQRDGWKVLVLWECETRNEAAIVKRLVRFLD